MKVYKDLYWSIISPANLFRAWEVFKSDKSNKLDVAKFEFNLEQNIFNLYRDLKDKTYKHGPYKGFWIHDPKHRHIHKATVRDRVLHHAIFRVLNPIFEPTFIPESFSCRIGKGTHRGVLKVAEMIRKESRNYSFPCLALKCDIKKFFDSIDHEVLLQILNRKIKDESATWLLGEVIESFPTTYERERESKNPAKKGVPIGNLTSQIFANIYMNIFDQFIKHELKVKNYARYTDDFIIIAQNKTYLQNLLPKIDKFLDKELKLSLHPNKIIIKSTHQGIDFLGYIILPHYRLVRKKTVKRMREKLKLKIALFREGKISKQTLDQSLSSFLGVLSHANAYKLSQDFKNLFFFF